MTVLTTFQEVVPCSLLLRSASCGVFWQGWGLGWIQGRGQRFLMSEVLLSGFGEALGVRDELRSALETRAGQTKEQP